MVCARDVVGEFGWRMSSSSQEEQLGIERKEEKRIKMLRPLYLLLRCCCSIVLLFFLFVLFSRRQPCAPSLAACISTPTTLWTFLGFRFFLSFIDSAIHCREEEKQTNKQTKQNKRKEETHQTLVGKSAVLILPLLFAFFFFVFVFKSAEVR